MKLVLVGAGHAHLAVVAAARRLRAAGLDPLLIAPAAFDYSGLAGAVLSGAMEPQDARIDVAALARKHGVAHRIGVVTAMDRAARTLSLSDGSVTTFDVVAFNIGSGVGDLPGTHPAVWPVKPLSNLFDLRRHLEAECQPGRVPALVVAGDGPTAFEIAASLLGLHEGLGHSPDVTLVGPDAAAGWAPSGAARRLIGSLDRRGLRRVRGSIVHHAGREVRLDNGGALPCDHLIVATGLRAPALTAGLDLPLDSLGRLRVSPTLQSLADPAVLAVGDCAVIEGHTRPFAGVFGVRAAAVLIDNLCAMARRGPLRPFHPQTRWLAILDLADGTALAMRGRLWGAGRLVLWLKRRLDLDFVERRRA